MAAKQGLLQTKKIDLKITFQKSFEVYFNK